MYAVSEQLTSKKLFALFLENINSYKISQKLVVTKQDAKFLHFFQIQRKNLRFQKYPKLKVFTTKIASNLSRELI